MINVGGTACEDRPKPKLLCFSRRVVHVRCAKSLIDQMGAISASSHD